MRIFKFGGASVKNAEAVKNVAHILKLNYTDQLVVVVSAMGKTTNLLESILYASRTEIAETHLQEFKRFHLEISQNLGISEQVEKFVEERISEIRQTLKAEKNEFKKYDSIVSHGELTSTFIISKYLDYQNLTNSWLDVRGLIKTTDSHKNANVNWESSVKNLATHKKLFGSSKLIITQGFIGSAENGMTTTLGREGSDFSAAILAYLLDAESVTIWKDVDGMLNADPRFFENTIKLDEVSYREAIELAYFGASVIHPKTVKPLENKNIPLYVKSFFHPENKGTVIKKRRYTQPLVPSYILKSHQVLISISPKDFSFIAENHLSQIFELFSHNKISVNLMQNSALNFSVVVDQNKINLTEFKKTLERDFYVRFNQDLELITIRHFTSEVIESLIGSKSVYLEQRSRNTIRLVVK